MSLKQIKTYCQLDEAGEGMMQMAMTELNLSARAYDRILEVSRTIAGLAGSEHLQAEHCGGGDPVQRTSPYEILWR